MIIPVLHRILVKQDALEDKDSVFAAAKRMGIQIARDEKDREQAAVDSGVVVAIGATAFLDFKVETSPIKVGDRIVYARYAGKTIVDPDDDVKYVALNDEDVVAIITRKEPVDG
jgi:co-chaperonin GroES (HSP10)